MTEPVPHAQRSFGRVQVTAIALAIAGIALTSLSWWFIMLTAMGTFGPGILREAGWLQDQDEFQRRADHRAGYHAFLVSGVLMFLMNSNVLRFSVRSRRC